MQIEILKDFTSNYVFENISRESEVMAEIVFLLKFEDAKLKISSVPEN